MTLPRGGAGRAEDLRGGAPGGWVTSSRGARGQLCRRGSGSLCFRDLGEMAEAVAAALVWIRGPGVGCRAVRDVWAAGSVQDLIHRQCQDQVRFVVPGRRGKEPDRGADGMREGLPGAFGSLGRSVS